jgi:hypothetical protein
LAIEDMWLGEGTAGEKGFVIKSRVRGNGGEVYGILLIRAGCGRVIATSRVGAGTAKIKVDNHPLDGEI